jgi:membrane protein implicated in regulation of membrane protease activity
MESSFFSPELIWFIIGLAFILLEFLIPGVIIIFFGIGAWVTALFMLFGDFAINTQLIVFLVSSLVLLVVLRKKVQKIFVGKSEPGVDDVDDIIGKKVKVIAKITPDSSGKVMFNGSNWNAEADAEIPEETIVEIVAKNNLTLKVKPINEEKNND